MKNILVIKNDRLGDFVISLPALNLILNKYKNENITFLLSDINFGFSYLLKNNNVDFIKTSYSVNFSERLNIFFYYYLKNMKKFIFSDQKTTISFYHFFLEKLNLLEFV